MPLLLVRNDITRMCVDAIVNAANNSLLGGGGVDGAIHRAAGPQLLEECRALNGCETGGAKLTQGYRLPCRWVIHTVGPVWQGGTRGERELLAACYRNSLALAREKGCGTLAFPLISAGAYGYPKAEALKVAAEEINRFLDACDMTVYLVLLSRDAVEPAGRLYEDIAAYIGDVYEDERRDPDLDPNRRQSPVEARPDGSAASLFRRRHREDDARNETLFADREPLEVPDAALNPAAALKRPEAGFSRALLRLTEEKGLTEAQCRRRANVDRRLFDRIKNDPDFCPGKRVALAFAVALRLPLEETRALLARAGLVLSRADKRDIAVEYCVVNGLYDITEINEALFKLRLQQLGD